MDYRRDVFPPVLALLLSMALHGALMGLQGWVFREPPPELDTVAIELLSGDGDPSAEAEAPPSADEPSPPRGPVDEPAEAPPKAPPPEPETVARVPLPPPEPPKPVAAPELPEPAAAPPPLPAPEAPPDPSPALPEGVEAASLSQADEAPVEAPLPDAPSLQDLLLRGQELASFSRREEPPDPAGGEAREATLTLGESDTRYRGYLQRVQNSIDVSWRWKEAILAAGRGGSVLVRFTLTPAGQVERVEVVDDSGSPILDREASEAVGRAPMPAFPGHWTIERLHLYAQFDYRLE